MRDFPETRWSQLLELRDPAHPRHAEHLERLAERYWRPVYHYVRALRPSGEADDLTQSFFAMLLGRRDLEKLSPERGSFRGFLKTALRNFLASAERAAAGRRLYPIEEAERGVQPGLGPEAAFDREWVRGVLMEAVGRLRAELEAQGRGAQFGIFRDYCLAEGAEPCSYDEVARRHGFSADDVRNRLREMRLRLRDLLRDLLCDYLGPGESVEDELRFVLDR